MVKTDQMHKWHIIQQYVMQCGFWIYVGHLIAWEKEVSETGRAVDAPAVLFRGQECEEGVTWVVGRHP